VKLFSMNGEPGVVAVGQEAQGIFAFGQFARGFVAVGQIAIGVVAIGQVSASVVGVGQVGIGVAWFTGMLGLGGRGFCLRLIPGIDPPRSSPATLPFEALANGAPGAEGFVRVDVLDTPRGARLALNGAILPVKSTPEIAWALTDARRKGLLASAFAHIRRAGVTLVCDRIVEIPGTRRTYGLPFQIARAVLLVGIAVAWWYAFAGFDASTK
jgi:hypothetical protein